MVAGEVLHGQVGPLAAHGIEEHGGAEGSIRPCVLVVDGEERGEAVGEVLLQAGEREVQLVDDSVTQRMNWLPHTFRTSAVSSPAR